MACFETLLLQAPLWDINAQPTVFARELIPDWNDAPEDFSLDLYVYYTAFRKNSQSNDFRFSLARGCTANLAGT